MKYIIAFLISMTPLVELRGAVPIAIASGIPWWQALVLCMIGNMLPVPIIFFFARRVLKWGADKPLIGGFFTWCLKKGHSGGQKLEKAAGDKGTLLGPSALCRNSTSRNRSLDWYACSIYPRLGL